MSNVIKEKKYAVMLHGQRITDYVYDDVIQASNTLYGIKHEMIGVSTIHAYSKQDGKVLFRKDVENYKLFDDCLILEESKKKQYVYFDFIQNIKGPFNEVTIEKNLIEVKSLINDKNLYGAYDIRGNCILPIKYNHIFAITNNLIEVGSKKQKIGLVNRKSEWLLEPVCASVNYYFDNTLITFYNAHKGAYGAISQYGTVIFKCKYESIEVDEKNKLVYYKENNSYGLYKVGNGIVFKPTFRSWCKNRVVVELIGHNNIVYGYVPKLDLFLPRRYYVYLKNHLKYFDGYKWRKLKYDAK